MPISLSHDEPRSSAMFISALVERCVEFFDRPVTRGMSRRGSTWLNLTTKVCYCGGGRQVDRGRATRQGETEGDDGVDKPAVAMVMERIQS